MKQLLAGLLVAPLLIGVFASDAQAGTVTRIVTTSASECRDFTKTTTYVNRVVTTTGTACLYPDNAWHDVTAPGEPIIQYEDSAVIERPVVYQETQIVPVPVYYSRPRVIYRPITPYYYGYDRTGHYDHDGRGPGRGPRDRDSVNFDIRGRL